jgi:hypothetical protein
MGPVNLMLFLLFRLVGRREQPALAAVARI